MLRRETCQAVHIASLGLWIGIVGMAALTAAMAFPAMKGLNPSLPGFPAVPGDHWSIAGGRIANPVLTTAVWWQVLLSTAAVVTLFPATRRAGWIKAARRIAVIGAFALAIALTVLVLGRMQPAIHRYWDAAEAGDVAAAQANKAEFDGAHPMSSRLIGGTMVLALIALALAVVDHRPEAGAGPS